MDDYLKKSIESLGNKGNINTPLTLMKNHYALLHNYGLKFSKNSTCTEDYLQNFFLDSNGNRYNLKTTAYKKSQRLIFYSDTFLSYLKSCKIAGYKEIIKNIAVFNFSPQKLIVI